MRSPIRRRRCSGCTAKVVMCASSTISQSPAYPTMRPPSRATRCRAFLFCVSSWRNAFAGHGIGNDARSTSCTPSMSSRLISSMTIGNVATILLKLSGALRETERALVRRGRRERLLERSADRRLSHVERLDLAHLHLGARFELPPGEFREGARGTYPLRRGPQECP